MSNRKAQTAPPSEVVEAKKQNKAPLTWRQELDLLMIQQLERMQADTRIHDQIKKLSPIFTVLPSTGNRVMTICELRGTNHCVLATGVAWKSPKDDNREDVGKKIAFARAVRTFTARRMGVLA